MSNENSRLVYSTEQPIPKKNGRGRPPCPPVNKNEQKVRIRLDRKGRGGKTITVIEGLQMPQKQKEKLLKQFKAGLGTGGTVKDTDLEIQGDHCDALIAALEKIGYKPKRSGR